MNHYIYIHQNKENLRVYIGYSNNYTKRWYAQKRAADNTNFRNYDDPFYRAIRKYTWEGFTHNVIEEFDVKEDALEAEKFWIEFFRANIKVYGNDYGYNMHEGGNLPPSGTGRSPSQETRDKISASLSGEKHPLFGKKASKETKDKMSKTRKGHLTSKETRQKIGAKSKGRTHSEESKEKNRIAHLGKIPWNKGKGSNGRS